MQLIEWIFWIAAALVGYTYAGYPLLLALFGALRSRKPQSVPPPRSASVIIAAKNEEKTIARRTIEFLETLARCGINGELIIVSDGSTDGTVDHVKTAVADSAGNIPCHVIALASSHGKAAALTRGCELASKEIIIFADARQTWAPDAIDQLLTGFADKTVGAVSGDLILETSPGVMAGVGFYWRYEKWLRRRESDFHSMVGATGAISAVRRELFKPIPAGTILDDVYWPMNVAMQGFRVVQTRAAAFDRLPEKARDEFRRKVRTLSGNFQLALRLPGALLPWRNPIWLQYLSHKLMRLVVPWLLLIMLAISIAVPTNLYRALLIAELAFLFLGAAGMFKAIATRSKLASASASFLVLNTAAWMAFWVWTTGKSSRSWTKLSYPGGAPAPVPVAESSEHAS